MHRGDQPGFLRDSNLSFEGGVDGSRSASDIGRNQVAGAVNATFREGRAKPRPGWKQRKLTFAQGCKSAFEKGFYHAAALIYNGATFDSILTSQGGRQFKVDIDSTPGALTTTTADFTIPALNATVAVTVDSTSNLGSQSTLITIGAYQFTLVSIDSLTQLTVENTTAANAGLVVTSGAGIQFVGTWEVTEITPQQASDTMTIAQFTVPAVNATVNVSVQDATAMTTQLPSITINGLPLTLLAVLGPTSITVENKEAGNVGVIVAISSAVTFSMYSGNNPLERMNWSIQAENYWILQNNKNYPVIFDGSKTFRADPAKKQIPVGNVMAYAFGRIAVALPDRQTYRIGDLIFGQSGHAQFDGKDAILYFQENDYLNEGGDLAARVFGAPSNSGEILSMRAAQMTDNSLGQGPLLIGTPNMFFSVILPFDRTTWKNLSNPLQSASPIKGPTGQNSTVDFDGDQWYRSLDGIRSYITAQRQFNGAMGNTAQSNEVGDLLDFDTKFWLEYGSGAIFDNRLLMTISPQMTPNGCYHRGLVSLDFDLSTSIRGKLPPAWEGMWTGLRILQVFSGIVKKEPRCFMFVLNDDSEIELWELSTEDKFDEDGATPITWSVDSPSYHCGSNDQFKKLKTARLIITGLVGTVTGTVEYHSDEGECWNAWATFTRCAKSQDCATQTCPNDGPRTYVQQTRYPIRLPEPSDAPDPIAKRPKNTGYEMQLRIRVQGFFELKSVRIFCLPETENLGIANQNET